jgi:DNA-nicking Smr family endonuclease
VSRRPLSPGEAALWQRLISTVEPLKREKPKPVKAGPAQSAPPQPSRTKAADTHRHGAFQQSVERHMTPEFFVPEEWLQQAQPVGPKPREPKVTFRRAAPPDVGTGLDGHWDRRFTKGNIEPDATVDLHGHTLQTAYHRLDQALAMAVASGQRIILLITGKARADGSGRGAIRAAVNDWLAASRHARHIAGVRNAHPRHGGEGALYIILKRTRT